ncbi:ubiA prenyltransferase domain-containing protein 1 homolog [Ylistrum balloti]|uniref:ubiA prenyltransferase domain-containing protein 1 homolog n=1 Tax=Ylistrum balloti TaxID=509963 RepID=UPI002905DBFD|nr:ubiA prenyltransferase domain-containing protein 1 homolog [Ylistrum balloti]
MASVPNGVEKHAQRNNSEAHFLSKEAVWRQFQQYVVALRPWSFTASFTPVALGSTLAYKTSEEFSLSVFIITCLTALSVHAAGNLVNTYFDYVRGIDKKVNSDDRTLVDMILTPDDVATLGGVFYIFGCMGFFILTLISPARMEHLALIYFGGLSSSFLYTGGLGLKYIALGDILIMLTFGPLTVIFSYLSQTGYLSLVPMLYAFPLALNTEAILHCNNTRDMISDKKAGIVTLAILLGKTGSYLLYVVLVFAPYTIFCLMGIHCSKWMFLPVLTIFMAFQEDRKFRQGIYNPKNTAKLNLILGLLYILGCALSDRLSFKSLL